MVCCFFLIVAFLATWYLEEWLICGVYFCCSAADIISTVEFNHSGELLATGDKGGRVVIFQQEQEVSAV